MRYDRANGGGIRLSLASTRPPPPYAWSLGTRGCPLHGTGTAPTETPTVLHLPPVTCPPRRPPRLFKKTGHLDDLAC